MRWARRRLSTLLRLGPRGARSQASQHPKVRTRGEKDGITRAEAERGLRRLVEAESRPPTPAPTERPRTVDEVCEAVRERIALEGARPSYRQNCESMQRIHISPAMGRRRINAVTQDDVERLASAMLRKDLAPKTVRNVMTFLYSVFAHASPSGGAGSRRTRSLTRAGRSGGVATRLPTSDSSPSGNSTRS